MHIYTGIRLPFTETGRGVTGSVVDGFERTQAYRYDS